MSIEQRVIDGEIIAWSPVYRCPCCGAFTRGERGAWDICRVCRWEDDPLGMDDVGLGPNHMGIDEYRREWQRLKAEAVEMGRGVER